MKRLKFLKISYLVGIILISLAACLINGCTKPAPTGPVVLRFHHPQLATGTAVKLQVWFLDELEKRSEGLVIIERYWGGVLGEHADALASIKAGAFDLGSVMTGLNPAQTPLNSLMWFPLAITDNTRAWGEAWTNIMKMPELSAEFERWDAKFLYYSNPIGARNLFSSKPVKSFADLSGLKIRSSGAEAEAFQRAGAACVTTSMPEGLELLMKGTLNAATTGYLSTTIKDFVKYSPNRSTINLGMSGKHFVIKLSTYNKLPNKVKEVISQLIKEAPAVQASQEAVLAADIYNLYKQWGVTTYEFPKADQVKWEKECVFPCVEDWLREMEKEGLPGQKVYDKVVSEIQNAAEKYAK